MKTRQRIWILSELYFPEETSTGYFITKIAEGLAEEYEVNVITGPATNSFIAQNRPEQEVINKVEIFRCRGTTLDKNIVFKRLINIITRATAIFWKSLLLCQRGDTILVVTNPPIMPFIALVIKQFKGSQFILLIHDVYPEILVATGLCKPSSAIDKIGQIMNRVLYEHACRIITLGRDMTRLAKAKLSKEQNNKIYCIPHWADNDIISTDKRQNAILQKLGVSDKFVVIYAGNMGRTHGLEYVAEAAQNLRKFANIQFIISGLGAKKKWLKNFVNDQSLENVTILNPCFRSELIVLLNACDVAVISFIPGMAGVSVPSRMYNQMAAGKPIIAVTEDWSELAEVIREEEIGWVVQPGDVAGLVSTIQFAAEHPDLCNQMGSRAATVAKTKYTFSQIDQCYKELFRELFATSL